MTVSRALKAQVRHVVLQGGGSMSYIANNPNPSGVYTVVLRDDTVPEDLRHESEIAGLQFKFVTMTQLESLAKGSN